MIEGVHVATQEHTPVMVREVVRALNIKDGGIYIDATFGRGGHTRAILDRLDSTGRVVAILSLIHISEPTRPY